MAEPIILIMDGGELVKIMTASGQCPPIISFDWTDIWEETEGNIEIPTDTEPHGSAEPCWVGYCAGGPIMAEVAPPHIAEFARSVAETGIDSNAKAREIGARMAAQTEGGPSFT